MSKRKHSPLHDKWHPRIEGQIRDCIHAHPEWFSVTTNSDRETLINSLAKRIVGEIVAEASIGGIASDDDGVLASDESE